MGDKTRQSWRWAQVDWGDDDYRTARSELVGYLDEVMVETKAWRDTLAVVSTAATAGADPLAAALPAAPAPDGAGIAKNVTGLVGMHPTLRELFQGDAAALEDVLAQLVAKWPAAGATPTVAVADVKAAETLAADIALRCVEITLPVWASRELAEMTTGQVLDFHAHYSDYLPDASVRQELLTDLARRSRSVPAYIVPAAEQLYRTPNSSMQQLWFTVAPFLAVAACAGVAAVIGNLHAWWPSNLTDSFPAQWNNSGTLLGGYIAAVLGAIAHLYVDWSKATSWLSGQGIVVPRRIRQRLELYASQLAASAGVVLVVSLAWIWMMNKTDAATMILVGYSADSLLSAFITRFRAFAPGASAALVKQV
jgi:hypothetical protein